MDLKRTILPSQQVNSSTFRCLHGEVIEIKDMEISATRRALADMEKVTDRSLKLAETVKPKSNWQVYGLLAVIAFVAGLAVGL